MLIMILISIPAWLAYEWICNLLFDGIKIEIIYEYQKGTRDSLTKYSNFLSIFSVYFVNIVTISTALRKIHINNHIEVFHAG